MTHYWTQTMGSFRPSFASDEKHGTVIMTELNNDRLIDAIIGDHARRSPKRRELDDYRPEDYSDEIRIYLWSGGQWRTLINLQYEGGSLDVETR